MLDPARIDGTYDDVVATYERAELYLIRLIADAIRRAGESPTWAEAQLLAIRQTRGHVEGMAQALQDRLPTLWHTAIDRAYMRGRVDAEAELAGIPNEYLAPAPTVVNDAAVTALVLETYDVMTPVHQNILRRVDDIWRDITREATGYAITGAMTSREAASRAFTRMARDGLGFYTDKAGRKWGLDTYAEMAVRTATNRALRAGHTETMIENGIDLVVVSSHKNPAPQCAPFERKVLSLTGQFSAGTHRINNSIVSVKATLRDAEASGLHHPNCRHTTSAYVPGFTRLGAPVHVDDGHAGYKATQKQRYLERQIRASKRMEAAAVEEQDVRAALERKRAYQKKLREHVAKWDLPRRRRREQLRQPASGVVDLSFDD